eukprot:902926-Amphidinium_carterae.2
MGQMFLPRHLSPHCGLSFSFHLSDRGCAPALEGFGGSAGGVRVGPWRLARIDLSDSHLMGIQSLVLLRRAGESTRLVAA